MRKLQVFFFIACLALSSTLSSQPSSLLLTDSIVTLQEIESVKVALGFDFKAAEQVFEGFLIGLATSAKYTDIQACIEFSVDVINNLIDAYVKFAKKDPLNVARGFEALGKALKQIPTAIQACKGAVTDAQKLIDALKKVANPLTFIYHVVKNLIFHGYDIYKTVSQAVSCFKAQDWKGFGVHCGEAFYKMVLYGSLTPSDYIVSAKDSLLVEKGIIDVFLPAGSFKQLLPCLNVTATAFGIFVEKALDSIVTQDNKEVLVGVQALGSAFELISSAAQQCRSNPNSTARLTSAISALKNANTARFSQTSQSLLINNREIWPDTVEAIVNRAHDSHE